MAITSVWGADRDGRAGAGRRRLVAALDERGDELARRWKDAAGPDVERWPGFDRYLRRLIAGLAEVFRGGGWDRTQEVIDDLARLRVRSGVGLEQSLQRALLAGRRIVRNLCEPEIGSECEELMLEALHECVFRFSESYSGLQLESESERMNTRIIKSLTMTLEARDPYTKGHSLSVAMLAQKVAEVIGPSVDRGRVYLAGLLHDVGKIGIPDNILLKPDPLTPDEWEVMKRHPVVGASILKPIKLYADVVSAVLTHHENHDGSGYPYGLRGTDIPPISRILRVVDSFDAITTTRAHRASRPAEEAIAEIQAGSGAIYDPATVEAFTDVVNRPGVMSELTLATVEMDMTEVAI